MERPTTILDVFASPTGKWIVIFGGILLVCLAIFIFAPDILGKVATKVIPRKERKDESKSQQRIQPP